MSELRIEAVLLELEEKCMPGENVMCALDRLLNPSEAGIKAQLQAAVGRFQAEVYGYEGDTLPALLASYGGPEAVSVAIFLWAVRHGGLVI